MKLSSAFEPVSASVAMTTRTVSFTVAFAFSNTCKEVGKVLDRRAGSGKVLDRAGSESTIAYSLTS